MRALLAGLLALLCAPSAWADGAMLDARSPGALELAGQKAQRAWLEWKDGRETLTVAVEKSRTTPRLAWLLPLPAPAKDVTLKVVRELPGWNGRELRGQARYALWKYALILYFLAVFLLFSGSGGVLAFLLVAGFLAMVALPSFGPSPGASAPLEAATFAHVELGGLTSELVEAPSVQALKDYLKGKSCVLPESLAKALEGKLGTGSLVVSWAEGSRPEGSLAIQASFPTPKPFYPMKLTSAYGKRILSVDLKLKGWHEPAPEPPGGGSYRWGYYHDPAAKVRYTRVLYRGEAASSAEGWTFSPKRLAAGLWLALTAAEHPVAANLLLLLVSGMAAALLVGLCSYPDWRGLAGLDRLCLLGLSMALPYYGPAACLRRWRKEGHASPAFWALHLACPVFILLFSYGLFKVWPMDRAPVVVTIGGERGLLRKSHEGATRGNLSVIRAALEVYHGEHESYPPSLSDLVKDAKYLQAIPPADLFPYHPRTDAVASLSSEDYTAGQFGDTGGWAYVNEGRRAGTVVVDCEHTDTRGKLWTEY